MIEDKKKIVTQILGSYWQKGDEHLYHCPYCGHHKKKMSINFANGYWKCWVCDTRGKNIYRIVRKFGNYQQRQKYENYKVSLILSDFEQMFKEYNNIEEKQSLRNARRFFSLCNNKDLPMDSTEPFRYLSSRGIGRKQILKWKIGYCKEGRYADESSSRRLTLEEILIISLLAVMLGILVGTSTLPADRDLVFNELNIDWDEPVVLVEGVFDAIAAGNNAIPILGSHCERALVCFKQSQSTRYTSLYGFGLRCREESRVDHQVNA